MEVREVTLPEMLDARDRRAYIQTQMLSKAPERATAGAHVGAGGTSPDEAAENAIGKAAMPYTRDFCLICFTMNIAGPIKNSPLILRAFHTGTQELELSLKRCRISILERYEINEVTGNEAFYTVDAPAMTVKRICCELESDVSLVSLGRLFDMDVLYIPYETSESTGSSDNGLADGITAASAPAPMSTSGSRCHQQPSKKVMPVKVDRQALGFPERRCIICGAPGKDCASRRIHTVTELQERTNVLILAGLGERDISGIAEYAVRSLLYEVCTTPKPGLVDRNNSGSHNDMDVYTFMNSAASLHDYFRRCTITGHNDASTGNAPRTTFSKLRSLGKSAENRMLRATGGVNTHRGAIFTMGIVCGALGRLSAYSDTDIWGRPAHIGNNLYADKKNAACGTSDIAASARFDPALVARECAAMTEGIVAEDMADIMKIINGTDLKQGDTFDTDKKLSHLTHGQRLYLEYGITGVRGQIEAGLPAVIEHGLPLLERLLAEGKSEDEAGAAVLLSIIATTEDTNLITRSNVQTQRNEATRAAQILKELYGDGLAAHNSADRTYKSVLEELDKDYISRQLSPGGSADLLAVCWMLHFCKEL